MTTETRDDRPGRETRLLLLVIVVAVSVLVLLARFRFPAADPALTPPAPGPLEGLAARATLDDVGGTVASLVHRMAPWIAVARFDPEAPPDADPAAVASTLDRAPVWMPALRVRSELAVVAAPAGTHLESVLGEAGLPEVVALDRRRGVAFVRLGRGVDGFAPAAPAGAFAGYAFVAAIEAGVGGPSARPIFLGRVDPVQDERWGGRVLLVGGQPGLAVGTLLFDFGGRFLGLVCRHRDGVVIVPPAAIDAAVDGLTGGDSGRQ